MTRHLSNPLRRLATPRPNPTRLDLQRLDDRLTPAAVTGVSGGVLFITGDAGDNDVTFHRAINKATKAEVVRVLDHGQAVGQFPLAGLTGFRFDGGGGDAAASTHWMPRITDTTAAVDGDTLFVRGDALDNQVTLYHTGFVTKGSRDRDVSVYDGDYRVATFSPAALRGVTGVRFDGGPGTDTFSGDVGLRRLSGTTAGVRDGVLFIAGDADNNDITFHRVMTKGKVEAMQVLDFGQVVGQFPLAGLSGFRFDGGGGEDTVGAAGPRLPRITNTTAAIEGGALVIRGDAGDNQVQLQRSGFVTKGSRERDIDVYDGDYKVASFAAAAVRGVTGVRFEGGPGVDTLALGRTGLPRLSGAVAGVAEGLLQITGDAGDNEIVLHRTLSKGRGETVRVLDHGQELGVFPLAGLAGVRFRGGEGTDSIATGPWLPRVTGTTAAIEKGVLFVRGDAGDNAVRVVQSGFVTKGSRERDISVYDGDYLVATFTVAAVRGVTGVRFDGGPGIDTLANSTSLTRLTGTTAQVRWPDSAPPIDPPVASSRSGPLVATAKAQAPRFADAEAIAEVAFDFHGVGLAEKPPGQVAGWHTLDLPELEVDHRDSQ